MAMTSQGPPSLSNQHVLPIPPYRVEPHQLSEYTFEQGQAAAVSLALRPALPGS
jgi:hypothetical protein